MALESTSLGASDYYFSAILAFVVVIAIACQSADFFCIIYAILLAIGCTIMLGAIFPTADVAFRVLYSPPLDYSLIVYVYELFMLLTGGAGVGLSIYHRTGSRYNSDYTHYFRVKKG